MLAIPTKNKANEIIHTLTSECGRRTLYNLNTLINNLRHIRQEDIRLFPTLRHSISLFREVQCHVSNLLQLKVLNVLRTIVLFRIILIALIHIRTERIIPKVNDNLCLTLTRNLTPSENLSSLTIDGIMYKNVICDEHMRIINLNIIYILIIKIVKTLNGCNILYFIITLLKLHLFPFLLN